MAYIANDLKAAFSADGVRWERLKIDGGMAANNWMAQALADILDLPVERPDFVETTALGAAMLAGVRAGLFGSLEDAAVMRGKKKAFDTCLDPSILTRRMAGGRQTLSQVCLHR